MIEFLIYKRLCKIKHYFGHYRTILQTYFAQTAFAGATKRENFGRPVNTLLLFSILSWSASCFKQQNN